MSTTAPQKQFMSLRSKHNSYLLCFVLLLLSTFFASGQEQPRLLIPQSFAPELPVPKLTPSGQQSVVRPISAVTPLVSLPYSEQPAELPTLQREELNLVIQEGQVLESQARWSEALAHYESALRLYRNEAALMDYYRTARFHCDIERRFRDVSYLGLLQTLSVVETLNFFEDVLSQIQREYADSPRWEPLFQHGIQNFGIAFTDANFRTKVNLGVSDEQIAAYLSAMKTTVDGWIIRDREDMKNGILHIAEGAQNQLGLNPVVTLMEFTCGMTNSLDPNTTYLTPNQLNDYFSAIYGNLVGLGVELRSDRESLLIVRVIPGSPAEENGLKANDRILTVDGIATQGKDTDSAANLLQGTAGTSVKLSVLSAGLGQNSREVVIIRRQIEVPSVEDVQMINDKLGYIRLTGFQKKTAIELEKALIDLNRRGMKVLVLDLRHNPGGSLEAGIEVANLFIEEGAIVRTQGRNRTSNIPTMAKGKTWHVPLIMLVDGESASAAEIVAGAIRDHNRGTLIGKQTYGKGTIQKINTVPMGTAKNVWSGVKLTTEKFYSPKGLIYTGVGVTPHIVVSEENRQWTTSARPVDGRVPLPLPRSMSSPDDPYIQEAVRVSQAL